mgnify:CR=1 FL=1
MDGVYNAILRANSFVNTMEVPSGFKLFERSGVSPYARCFAIFTKALCQDKHWLDIRRDELIHRLNEDFSDFYFKKLMENIDLDLDKPVLQLFCFTLSALSILDGDLTKSNLVILKKYLDVDTISSMFRAGVGLGLPGSGNHAMFKAVLLIYADQFLGVDKKKEIEKWLKFNAESINRNGFWGNHSNINHLQFQNGYHQYEIFEYLGYEDAPWENAALNTLSLADHEGHFAPYPGGGGCYDYDAIFMLTSRYAGNIGQTDTLGKTLASLIREQNRDGGFCESKSLKRYNLPSLIPHVRHVMQQPKHLRVSSLVSGINLARFKHTHIRTHWTDIDRRWDESNLWDTFFRLSTINRVCSFLDLPDSKYFSSNNFPGIG